MINGKKPSALFGAVLVALGLMTNVAAAQDYSAVNANGTLLLGGYGNFFIPGNLATCPTPPPPCTNSQMCSGTTNPGLHMINQMYVQFMLPVKEAKKRRHYPIGIVHGCCLSTKSWQTTPDGRMGWDEYFVRQKFDTYMIDQVGRARSGFDADILQFREVRYYDPAFLPQTAFRSMPPKPQHPDSQ